MAQDTLLGFPAHTLPYRCGKFTTLSTVSIAIVYWGAAAKTPPNLRCGSTLMAFDEAAKTPLHEL